MKIKNPKGIFRITVIILLLVDNIAAFGAWKGDYVAKVNGEIIAKDEFKKKLEGYHTIKNIGEKMPMNIPNVDYAAILKELIDEHLMIQEAVGIGLDKTAEFKKDYKLSKLNISLAWLRREEVSDKVSIPEDEIIRRYVRQTESVRLRHISVKDEKKGKILLVRIREGEDFSALAKNESGDSEQIKAKGGDIGFRKRSDLAKQIADVVFLMEIGEVSDLIRTKKGFHILKLEERKIPDGDIPPGIREKIYETIYNEMEKVRGREYLESFRKDVDISIEHDALRSIKRGYELNTKGVIIARFNGVNIKSDELHRHLKGKNRPNGEGDWEEIKRAGLETLVTRKLLDIEALERNYEVNKGFRESIRSIKNAMLIKYFKSDIIWDAVKLKSTDIKNYYEMNRQKFKEPEKVKLSIMAVLEREKADLAIEELKAGADIDIIAYGISESNRTKVDTRWFVSSLLSPVIQKKTDKMEPGVSYGPFFIEEKFYIVKFIERKEGNFLKFGDVKDGIANNLRIEKYNQFMLDYLSKLRSAADIDINNSVLNGFIKKKRGNKGDRVIEKSATN